MEEDKGFVLTLDALFAVLLMTVFLAAMSFSFQEQPKLSMLSKTGHDFLTALDKDGTLLELSEDSNKQTFLDNLVNKLPVNTGGRLSTTIYEYKNEQFQLDTALSATRGSLPDEKVVMRRVFTNVDKSYYGIMQLEIWYE